MSRFVPRGVVVAGLGKRFVASLLDFLPAVLLALAVPIAWKFSDSASVRLVVAIAAGVLLGCYGIAQWWAYGTRGAGLGAKLMGQRLVGIDDGEPIGWWRYFIRQLVFFALLITVVGGIAMLVFLVIQERRQGWHDMAGKSIKVEPQFAEAPRSHDSRKAGSSGTTTVGLPPHLASGFAPQVGTAQAPSPSWDQYAPTATERPQWMPHLESEPLVSTQHNPWQVQPSSAPSASPAPATDFPTSLPTAPLSQTSAPPAPQQPQRPVNQGWIPLPTPSSIIQQPEPPRVRERDFGSTEDDDGTHLAAPLEQGRRPGDEGWFIRLDDGREVALGVSVLLGRNPQKTQGDPDVQLVPAGGDGRMISRTHVMVGVDPRGVFVVDRGSTNGTAVVTSDSTLEPCPVGTQVRVSEGQQVSYGNRWFTVMRRPAV